MGTTPKGYPYPEGTDLVADGDNAIQALAEKINERAAYGLAASTISFSSTKPGTNKSKVVSFPTGRFTTAPNVVTNPRTSEPTTRSVSATTISKTSFTCIFQHSGSTASGLNVDYIAMQYGGGAQLSAALDEPTGMVTCPTDGCENAGVPIPVPATWTDEDGATHPVDEYQCGACGTDLTDTLQEAP